MHMHVACLNRRIVVLELSPIRDQVTGADSDANNTTYWVTGHGEHDGGDQSARKLYASGRIRGPEFGRFSGRRFDPSDFSNPRFL